MFPFIDITEYEEENKEFLFTENDEINTCCNACKLRKGKETVLEFTYTCGCIKSIVLMEP